MGRSVMRYKKQNEQYGQQMQNNEQKKKIFFCTYDFCPDQEVF